MVKTEKNGEEKKRKKKKKEELEIRYPRFKEGGMSRCESEL